MARPGAAAARLTMPGRRLFLPLGIAAFLFAASVAVPALAWAAAAVDLFAVIAFAVDLGRARAVRLRAVRRRPGLLAQGAAGEIEIAVGHQASRPVPVRLRDALHPAIAAGTERHEAVIPAGATLAWRYRLVPRRRGRHEWGPLTARVRGPWGFAWSQRELIAAEPVQVFPQVRWGGRVGRLLALARRHELGQSPWRTSGAGGEPYALRAYVPGDPPNRIHWRATARHGKLVTREETWEQGAHLVVLLDAGRAMASVEGERSKLDHALATTLALLRLALGRGDRVSVLAFSDRVERRVRTGGRGGGAVREAYASLFDLEARLVESAFDAAVDEAFRLEPRRAVAVLCTSVTDLAVAESLRAAVLALNRRYRTLLVNLEDPQVSALAHGVPDTPRDAIAKVAAMEIVLANRQLGRGLRRAGIATVTTPADRLALDTLDAYLGIFQGGRARRAG